MVGTIGWAGERSGVASRGCATLRPGLCSGAISGRSLYDHSIKKIYMRLFCIDGYVFFFYVKMPFTQCKGLPICSVRVGIKQEASARTIIKYRVIYSSPRELI